MRMTFAPPKSGRDARNCSTARISVVFPDPELPMRRMFGAGCPTRCFTSATAISRRTSSCPTTVLCSSSKTSRGRKGKAAMRRGILVHEREDHRNQQQQDDAEGDVKRLHGGAVHVDGLAPFAEQILQVLDARLDGAEALVELRIEDLIDLRNHHDGDERRAAGAR